MGKSASASDPELSRLGGVLDDMQRRVGDLEERVDFAERLLAKQRDAERLASGGASGPS
jgi:hypothetical protein